MTPAADPRRAPSPAAEFDDAVIAPALPFPVLLIDETDTVVRVNAATEQFFGVGAAQMQGRKLAELLPSDSPVISLLAQVRAQGSSISEYDVTVFVPRAGVGMRRMSISAAPLDDSAAQVVVTLHPMSTAHKIDQQLVHRSAARSVSALSRMLAHEVKNPLSGIRGAAQLLEQTVEEGDRPLTRLIRDEVDRICALVDRMGVFAQMPFERGGVNIHEVLERVRMIASAGFARNVRFVEHYDPSLPHVYGNRDQLIQIFLNLVKNAAEAAPPVGGKITITTSFRHGFRLALPGGDRRIQLPLVVTIEDNGPGIPEELKSDLFEPFVTGRPVGTGLGLALVAKLVGDHSGVVEFDSEPGRTVFRVMLPVAGNDTNSTEAETGTK